MIDASTCEVPEYFQSVRPYHWSAETEEAADGDGEDAEEEKEGNDHQGSPSTTFQYVLDIYTSSEEGVTLSRDTKKEEEEQAIKAAWNTEEDPERSEKAKLSRAKHARTSGTETEEEKEAWTEREKRIASLHVQEPTVSKASVGDAEQKIVSEKEMSETVAVAIEAADEEAKTHETVKAARALERERYAALEKAFLGLAE